MPTMSKLAERMIQELCDADWIDQDRINAVVTRAIEIAESYGSEHVMPIDVVQAVGDEIESVANAVPD